MERTNDPLSGLNAGRPTPGVTERKLSKSAPLLNETFNVTR